MGRYEDAHRELERAAALTPQDAVILEHLARVKIKIGHPQQARAVAERALQFVSESEDKEVGTRLKLLLEELEQ